MTKQERDMMADIYRLLDKGTETSPSLDGWAAYLEEYKALWQKWHAHPMIQIITPAVTEYLEKRWDHMEGKC